MSKHLFRYETFRTLEKPLSHSEKPKILFRFPGPCGLHELSLGSMKTLAPSDLPNVFLFKDRYDTLAKGVDQFGVFTIISPESFEAICLDDKTLNELNYAPEDSGRIFLGANKNAEEQTDFIWIPSRIYNSKSEWSQTDPQILSEIAKSSSYQDERRHAFANVHNYMEEVAQVESAIGVQTTPWYLTSPQQRTALLKKAGIKSRWTPST